MNWRNFRWSIDIRSFNMWHEWAASLWKYCRALHRRFQVFMIQVFGTWDWWMITHYCPWYRKLLIPKGSASFHNSLSIINRLIHIPNKILGLRQSYRRRSDMNQWFLLWISWIIISYRLFLPLYHSFPFPVQRYELARLVHEVLLIAKRIHTVIQLVAVKICTWSWWIKVLSLKGCAFQLGPLGVSCAERHLSIVKALFVGAFIDIVITWTTYNDLFLIGIKGALLLFIADNVLIEPKISIPWRLGDFRHLFYFYAFYKPHNH